MNLKGHYALFQNNARASFRAHHENLNEDRPIGLLSATKMQPNDSRFWQYIELYQVLKPQVQVQVQVLSLQVRVQVQVLR